MISKFLQIRGIQPRISKNFLHHYLEQFFLTVGQNNFGNKIPIPVFVRLFNIFLGMLIRREVFSFPQNFSEYLHNSFNKDFFFFFITDDITYFLHRIFQAMVVQVMTTSRHKMVP